MDKRGSGILLHITSLPSVYGIGDLGTGAYRFVDFLAEAGQKYWQILPLNPTCTAYGNSPYSSFSAFAGNPILISPELMIEDGILSRSDVGGSPSFSDKRVNYGKVTEYKNRLFDLAYQRNKEKIAGDCDFDEFCSKNSNWLDDYGLFISIKNSLNKVDWGRWPEDLRDRKQEALNECREKLSDMILKEKYLQYIFFKQWHALRNYCQDMSISIIGDMPIYVNYDSSDVWANPEVFKLNEERRPDYVTGVPPDYFSSTGQLWGHPVYKWELLRETGYAWWVRRMEHNVRLFNLFRLDHFRGFVAYWEIKANEDTATNGRWVEAPAEDFFSTLSKRFKRLPIIAEDLGVITQDVSDVMDMYGFPGMRVLLFAFGKDLPTNKYAPHNYIRECVAYTGTHDNNTIRGWFKKETSPEDRERIYEYIGQRVSDKNIHWEFIRLAMASVADTVVIPMQDALGLGEESRMNLPASSKGNWEWRYTSEQLSPSLVEKLAGMTRIYGRV